MIFHLSGPLNIAIDFIAWLLIHVSVSVCLSRINPAHFNPYSWLFKERKWETNGTIYRSVLAIKKWKNFLPDGAAVSKSGFRKKHLNNSEPSYLQRFLLETCRAELTHWIIFLFSLLFFLWNEWWIGLIMIAYGLITNMPCIIAQRYNRIRLVRVIVSPELPCNNENTAASDV